MADEREPDVTEDPRQKGTSDQLPEERPEEEGGGEGRPGTEGGGDRAPGASDPGQATGNPGAAGAG